MFYDRLKNECDKQKIKITPTIEKCGVSKGSLKGWKNGGAPNSDIVKRLAEYLNVSTDYLLEITDDPTLTKKEAAHEGRQINEKRKRYMALYEELSDDEEDELMRYAEYIKSKRNQ